MNDMRDEALGAILDRAGAAIESEPVDRLPEVLRRGSRRRVTRFTAIGAAVAIFAGAVAWTGLTLPKEVRRIPSDVADWRTFASLEDNGWTIQVPPPWRIQELPACPNAPERIGVVVTNTDFEFLSPRGTPPECEDRFVFAGFPRDGVALAFHPRGIIPGLFEPPLDTTLPLRPELLIRTDGIVGGPAHSFRSVALQRDWLGVIRRYVGPEASDADEAALDQMLASFDVRGAPRWVDDELTTTREFPDLRVAITYPDNWHPRRFPSWSVIDAPNPMVGLSSPDLRSGSCRPYLLAPWIRTGRLRDPSVMILISDATEAWSPPDLGPRPEHFRFQDALEEGDGRCGDQVRTLRFGFEAAGRQIYVDVAVTWQVLRGEPEMLRYILDSIEISKA